MADAGDGQRNENGLPEWPLIQAMARLLLLVSQVSVQATSRAASLGSGQSAETTYQIWKQVMFESLHGLEEALHQRPAQDAESARIDLLTLLLLGTMRAWLDRVDIP